jgi:hypothetical protein
MTTETEAAARGENWAAHAQSAAAVVAPLLLWFGSADFEVFGLDVGVACGAIVVIDP